MTDDWSALNDKFRVELEYIGEGINGDYDDSDADDMPLLRFTAFKREGDAWEPIPDCSYCTMIPQTADDGVKLQAVNYMIGCITAADRNPDASLKRACELLSWIGVKNGKLETSGIPHPTNLHATLKTSSGETVSISDDNQIVATVYDGNLKAYSIIIEWCNVGDLENPTMGAVLTTREWRNQPDDKRKE